MWVYKAMTFSGKLFPKDTQEGTVCSGCAARTQANRSQWTAAPS